MVVTAEDIARLFACPVYTSAGNADPVSVRHLDPLGPPEIPAGFAGWVEKRQREYRAGRHHARTALAAAGQLGADIPQGLDGLPCFPEGFSGTITHTGRSKTFAAAAVCKGPTQIGVDAEFVRHIDQGMVDVILSPQEQGSLRDWIKTQSQFASLSSVALVCFSAKEAFYKCVYPRCRQKLGFFDARLSFLPEPGCFEVVLVAQNNEEIPCRLPGRYLVKDSLIVSGVTWERCDV